jgi:hypothetical protein
MLLDQPIFTVAEAAEMAGIGSRTARTWISEGFIGWRCDQLAAVAGATTILSVRSALAMAIAGKLTALGMSPGTACHAARSFTDTSNPLEAPGHHRDPGECFADPFTAIIVYDDGDSRVVRSKGRQLDEVLTLPNHRDGGRFLPVDFIVKKVVLAAQRKSRAAE